MWDCVNAAMSTAVRSRQEINWLSGLYLIVKLSYFLLRNDQIISCYVLHVTALSFAKIKWPP
jgi:hypothetical protein